jgi:hypothetical protein
MCVTYRLTLTANVKPSGVWATHRSAAIGRGSL